MNHDYKKATRHTVEPQKPETYLSIGFSIFKGLAQGAFYGLACVALVIAFFEITGRFTNKPSFIEYLWEGMI